MMQYPTKIACSNCRVWFDSIEEAETHTVDECSEKENHQMISVSFYIIDSQEQRFERIRSSIWAKMPWDYNAPGAESYGERCSWINKSTRKIMDIGERKGWFV